MGMYLLGSEPTRALNTIYRIMYVYIDYLGAYRHVYGYMCAVYYTTVGISLAASRTAH